MVEVLSEEEANFILAYRLYGPMASGNSQATEVQTESAADLELDLSQEPKSQFTQVLDLIARGSRFLQPSNQGGQGGSSGGQGGTSGQNSTQNRTIASPFSDDILSMATYLPTLMDACTIMDTEVIPGRINVNEAPREILLGIPVMTEEIVDEIISARSEQLSLSTTSTNDGTSPGLLTGREHETWLLGEGVVTLDEMKQFMPFLCAKGHVYRAQVVGYFQGGGPSARSEVIIDATGDGAARIIVERYQSLGSRLSAGDPGTGSDAGNVD